MRFLMNTLLAHPIPTLMHAFRQNPFWLRSALTAVFVSLRSPSLAIRGYRHGTIQLQLSIFWRQFNPAFQSCWLLAR